MAELTIPTVKSDTQKATLDALDGIREILSNSQKQQVDDYKEIIKLEEEKAKRDDELKKLLDMGALSMKQVKYLKFKNKLTLMYHKWIVKNKWFSKITRVFRKMAKGSEGFLSKLLKSLFLLAIFDPKGKFLSSILSFIIKMAVKFIEIIIKWAPIIAERMVHLFWNVLLPGLKNLGQAIAKALGFEPGGTMHKIFGVLAQVIPVGFLLMGLVSKLMPAIKAFGSVISTITGSIYKLANAVFHFFAQNKALTLKQFLFEKALRLKKFIFEKALAIKEVLFLKLKAIATAVYNAVRMVDPIFLIITVIVAAIALVIKFRKQIWGFLKKIGKKIYRVFGPVIDLIVSVFKAIGKVLKKIFKPIGKFFKWLGEKIAPALRPIKAFFSFIANSIGAIFRGIKNVFGDLVNWVKAVTKVGILSYVKASDEDQERFKKAARVHSRAQEIVEMAEEGHISKKSAGYKRAKAILSKTATDDGFESYAKTAKLDQTMRSLDRTIKAGEKAEERREAALEKNTDATNKNTDEMKKAKLEKSAGFKKIKAAFGGDHDVVGVTNQIGGLTGQM